MFQQFEPAADRSFAKTHLPKLRDEMKKMGLAGFLVPHDDAYLNEYLPAYAERLMWVSGFSGSAGFGIVMIDSAAIFSDGRYTLQLSEQVDNALFSLHDSGETKPAEWLEENAPKGSVIGYDPFLHARSGLKAFEDAAKRAGFTLQPVDQNPIDAAWDDQPAPPTATVRPHPLEFAGEASADKRQRLAKKITQAGADAVLLTAPTSLAWLFNIRGGDVHASPLPLGRAVLEADGTAALFLNPQKVSGPLVDHLGPDVELHAEAQVLDYLRSLGTDQKTVMVDPSLVPVAFLHALTHAGATLLEDDDPCALPRATKNAAELDGTRTAHVRDGVAVTRFLHWLAETTEKETITEIDAAQKLESFRMETNQLKDISFDTISAAGGHGASPHYRVNTQSNKTLDINSLYLVDSGGQYEDGTTDITRVIAVGTPTDEMIRAYTLVLKGHIALATAKFPKGTTGHQLDALARDPLWRAGLDYDHGTGHGVGSFLGVHEGPQRISKAANTQALLPGMICSNEPGYYKAGEFGIRIENLIIVTPPQPVAGGDREMLGFETITFAPLERELIDPALLTAEEHKWVDDYHRAVWEKLHDTLPADVAGWLKERTAPLA